MSESPQAPDPRIAGVGYPSFYVTDFEGTVAWWAGVLGPPAYHEKTFAGFALGDSWLTLFRDDVGSHPGSDPRNCEFALRVKEKAQVDELVEAFVAAGAALEMAPRDTWMYRKMRFGCVNTPHGIRVDVYFPLPANAEVEGAPHEA